MTLTTRSNWIQLTLFSSRTSDNQPSPPRFHIVLVIVIKVDNFRLRHELLRSLDWTLDRSHTLLIPAVVAIAARTGWRSTFCARCVAPASQKSLDIIVRTADAVVMCHVPQHKLSGFHIGISLLASYLRTYSVLHYTPKLVTHQGC